MTSRRVLRFTLLAGAVLAELAPAQNTVVWEAAAGVPPASADVPWRSNVAALTGTPVATITSDPSGLVFDSTARPEDVAEIEQQFLFTTLSAPSVLVAEVELALPAVTAGIAPARLRVTAPMARGFWTLRIGADEIQLEHRYSTSTSQGAVGTESVIGSTAGQRTYRLEVETTTAVGTVFVDGAPALVLQGSATAQQGVNKSVTLGESSSQGGARMIVRRIEHNLGGDLQVVCTGSDAVLGTFFFEGSTVVADDAATFAGFGFAPSAMVVPLVSTSAAPPVPSGRLEGLCIGRPFRRYLPGGSPLIADAAGLLRLNIDLSAFAGPVAAGDARFVQFWVREPAGASGFVDGRRLAFR